MNKSKKIIDRRRLAKKVLQRGCWYYHPTDTNIDFKPKKPITNIRVATIVGDKLYYSLQFECELLLLQENNWRTIFHYGKPDIVLIESFFESCTGHWNQALFVQNEAQSQLIKLLKYAHSLGIPTVFWQSIDTAYDKLFKNILSYFDLVCYSDFRSFDSSVSINNKYKQLYLPPAIQPKLHHPFRSYKFRSKLVYPLIYDGWGDLQRLGEKAPSILKDLSRIGLYIIDSRYYLFSNKKRDAIGLTESILGCVDYKNSLDILRAGKIGVTFEESTFTRTTLQWWTFEAIGCGLEVVHFGELQDNDLRKEIIEACNTRDEFLGVIEGYLNNEWQRHNKAQESRRKLCRQHTYLKRLETLCSELHLNGLKLNFKQKLVSCLAVVQYPYELMEIQKNFQQQTLSNKELIVVAITKENFCIQEDKNDLNINILHLPSLDSFEAYQVAVHYARGEYCIHFGIDCRDRYYLEDILMDIDSGNNDLITMDEPKYFPNEIRKEIKCNFNRSVDREYLLKRGAAKPGIYLSGITSNMRKLQKEQNFLPRNCRLSLPKNLFLCEKSKEYLGLNSLKNGRPPVKERIIAGMATIPNRVNMLPKVLERLIPQFDHIYVYLNGHEKVPDCVKQEKVSYSWSKDHGDLAASGKFYFLEEACGGYYFTVDDDLIYPPDYSYQMISTLKKYRDTVPVCVHGSIFGDPLDWYFERTAVFGSQHSLPCDRFITLAGSGTLAFYTNSISITFDDFYPEVMCDAQFSINARAQFIPIVSISRPEKWIQAMSSDPQKTENKDYWTQMIIDDKGRTNLAQSFNWNFFKYVPIAMSKINELYPGISRAEMKAHKFDIDFIIGARTFKEPAFWNSENSRIYNIRKYQFLRKKLKILEYIKEHNRQPILSELFTKESILKTSTRNISEIKEKIKEIKINIESVQQKINNKLLQSTY